MLKLKKIAITGCIGCGKSTVCDIFKEAGAYVVSSDELSHSLLTVKSPLGKKILKVLGKETLTDGEFDRRKVARKVFKDYEYLNKLERLLHPAILKEIEKRYEKAKQLCFRFFVVEMPLLFEEHQEKNFDIIITIYAKRAICESRLAQGKRKDLDKRMKRQLSIKEKMRRADFIIVNNGDLQELTKRVNNLIAFLCKE
jgi:dephospho-CoA kinase